MGVLPPAFSGVFNGREESVEFCKKSSGSVWVAHGVDKVTGVCE